MLASLRRFLAPPVFEGDDDKTHVARILNTILTAVSLVTAGYGLALPIIAPALAYRLAIVLPSLLMPLGLMVLMRRGQVRLAALLFLAMQWLTLTWAAVTAGGVRSPGFSGYMVVILGAGLLLGRRATIGFVVLSASSGLVMLAAEGPALLPSVLTSHTSTSVWVLQTAFFIVATVLLGLAARSISDALAQARHEIVVRKQVEEAVRQSEERLRRVVQHMPVMMDAFDAAGNIVVWNRECERVTGYRAEDVVGNPNALEWLYPDPDYRRRMLAEWAERGNAYRDWEWDIICRDGSVRTVSWSNISGEFPIPGWATWGIGVDVTERRRAEETLQLSEKRFRALIENSSDTVSLIDAQGVTRYASQSVMRMLGYAVDDYVGHSPFEWLHPDDLADNVDRFTTLAQSPGAIMTSQFRLRHRDGSWRWIEAVGRNLFDDLAVQAIVANSRDVTERRQAEEEIRLLNAELEERVTARTAQLEAKNRELEAFAYSVSHDLKAPLRGIDGYSRLLLQDYADRVDEEGRFFLNVIRKAAEQMSQLIDDLLAYSRLERRSFTAERVNPRALGEALVAERADDLRSQHVELQLAVACESACADAEGLAQTLRNLIDNALKFTRDQPAPRIEIGGRESDGRCLLWVRDNGIGFDMRYHDRIFDIFQRLHRAEDYPGTGIGLAIVFKAVQRMNGRVWAESAPGAGATFYVEIPR